MTTTENKDALREWTRELVVDVGNATGEELGNATATGEDGDAGYTAYRGTGTGGDEDP